MAIRRDGKRRASAGILRWVVCFAAVASAGNAAGKDALSPLSPAESLAHFHLDPGLTIELVACEPEVVDPIAMRFDENGRLWVVEMRDYPNGPPPGGEPLSQIRLLADHDGDGRYETSRVFATNLLFPTGLQPWQGGVIVTLAGEVAYLKDTNGDGQADTRETWFRGFTAENPQLRANHPRFAFDNQVYIANGLRGGAIIDPRQNGAVGQPSSKPLSISGMDFCFDPLSGACAAVSGNGQFGLSFNDFGRRFVCHNRMPLGHVVLENSYLARQPFLAVPSVVEEVAASGERSRVYPLTSAWTTSNLHAGQFTAACGVEIYRAAALGAEYQGNAFVCEPTGSFVHREILEPNGVSFASKPASDQREFLASDDAWFRPVNLETGPDGALYIVDMYRAVIEHPQFMPSELQQRADLRLGDDRGRIYRVLRAAQRPRPAAPRLSKSNTAELVELLRHPNAWWRETAARLIYERQDRTAIEPLEIVATTAGEAPDRVAALWALNGLHALSTPILLRVLADRDDDIRQHAIMLAESRLPEDSELRGAIIAAPTQASSRTAFRAALALGALDSAEVVAPLATIGMSHAHDPWVRRAVACAVPPQSARVLASILQTADVRAEEYDTPKLALVRELATVVGSRGEGNEVFAILSQVCDRRAPVTSACREAAITGLAQGVERRGTRFGTFVSQQPDISLVAPRLAAAFEQAASDAVDETLPQESRLRRIELLSYADSPRIRQVLLQLAVHGRTQPMQTGAAAALAGKADGEIGLALIAGFDTQTPAVRRATIDALAANAGGAKILLEAVESQQITRAEIDSTREAQLVKHADSAIRARAQKLLARTPPAERQTVLKDYQTALGMKGDPHAGRNLFRQHCAGCHHIGDIGVDVAPDISDSRVKTPAQLLTDILNPNQAIDNNYVSYTVVTHDGTVHTGILAAETASSITLKAQEAKTRNLLRADIESIRSSGVSLMPEGFERNLSHEQMADLISFIKNWRYLNDPIPAPASTGAGR